MKNIIDSPVPISGVTCCLAPLRSVEGWRLAMLKINGGDRNEALIVLPFYADNAQTATFPESVNDWDDFAKTPREDVNFPRRMSISANSAWPAREPDPFCKA